LASRREVEACGEDHDLPDAGIGGRGEVGVEVLATAAWNDTKCLPKSERSRAGPTSPSVSSWTPSSTPDQPPPTARQNTSAYGSTARGSCFCASKALAAATNKAVEPTLVVMS
jgi:hypothetical protein